MQRTLLAATFGALFLASPAWADKTKFPGVEKLMTEEEFAETGLEQLSEEQIKALNSWLLKYTAGEAAILRVDNKEVQQANKDFELLTRISGEFTGWSGDTIFRLENGQLWRQRLPGRHKYSGPPNPEIRISRNFMGFYKMTLVESGKSIGVKPIR